MDGSSGVQVNLLVPDTHSSSAHNCIATGFGLLFQTFNGVCHAVSNSIVVKMVALADKGVLKGSDGAVHNNVVLFGAAIDPIVSTYRHDSKTIKNICVYYGFKIVFTRFVEGGVSNKNHFFRIGLLQFSIAVLAYKKK